MTGATEDSSNAPLHKKGLEGVTVSCAILGTLAMFIVVARLWARKVIQKNNTNYDDYFVIAAIVI